MAREATVGVCADDYLYFVDRALDGMASVVAELGDELASLRPALPGANSPYGLLTHCLGVVSYWGGRVVAGREVVRDRAAEFDATGPVADLMERVVEVRSQLAADVGVAHSADPPRTAADEWAQGPDRMSTQGTALFHLYEELAQHHGQMQVLRDALLSENRSPDPQPAPAFAPDLSWLRAKHGVKWHRPGPDLVPAWVADMDFPLCPAVRTAIDDVLDRGDVTYPDWTANPLAEPFAARMSTRFGWSPDPGQVRVVTDLIQALQIVLDLSTAPGGGVVTHSPNYPPFFASVASMGRRLIVSPMLADGPTWTFDPALLDAELRAKPARVLLLVNPHNPTGHVFTRPELESLAELAERHDLLVVCDEIHAELIHDGRTHVPFAALGADTAARTVTVTSAGKAFNLAGMRTAVAHVGPPALRAAWDAQPADLYGSVNVLGVQATLAAWRDGDAWQRELLAHLGRQRDHLGRRMGELPGLTWRPPEATYLAWLDCRGADLGGDPAAFFRSRAGVEMSPGPDYGPDGAGHVRLNFATSRAILDDIVDRMARALT